MRSAQRQYDSRGSGPDLQQRAPFHRARLVQDWHIQCPARLPAGRGGGSQNLCPPPCSVWQLAASQRLAPDESLSVGGNSRQFTSGGLCRERTTDRIWLEKWRRRPDLNRGWRFCRPLPYHLATAPLSVCRAALAGAVLGRRWSGKRDSNPRLRPWQGRTLPLSYSRSP